MRSWQVKLTHKIVDWHIYSVDRKTKSPEPVKSDHYEFYNQSRVIEKDEVQSQVFDQTFSPTDVFDNETSPNRSDSKFFNEDSDGLSDTSTVIDQGLNNSFNSTLRSSFRSELNESGESHS